MIPNVKYNPLMDFPVQRFNQFLKNIFLHFIKLGNLRLRIFCNSTKNSRDKKSDINFQINKIIYNLFIFVISILLSFSPAVNAQTTTPDGDSLQGLEYIASYPDLMNTFGTNWQAGSDHYLNYGANEGRQISFNSCNYLASNPDLMSAFGDDYAAAAAHYITNGRFEGRTMLFDGYQYMLANPDVLRAVQGEWNSACDHYIAYGRFDGHPTTPGQNLIGLGNKCLDGGSTTMAPGSLVHMWDCVGNVPQQQWQLKSDGSVVGIGGNCLTPSNWSLDNGSPLIIWPCDSSQDAQKWFLNTDGNLTNKLNGSKCVDIAGMNSANGTTAWVWDCWGGSNQLWSPAAGVKLYGLAGKCLDAGTATVSFAANSRATLYSCGDVPQQQWVFDRGRIKGFGGLCLTMQNSQLYNGVPLVMTTCSDDPGPTGQHWYMRKDMSIQSNDNSSLCVNVLGANTADGSGVTAWTCTPSALNDKWVQKN